jgi:hypothetical protein
MPGIGQLTRGRTRTHLDDEPDERLVVGEGVRARLVELGVHELDVAIDETFSQGTRRRVTTRLSDSGRDDSG